MGRNKIRGIYKRGNIYWIRYADASGKVRYESARTTKLKPAVYLLSCRRKEAAEGKEPEKRKPIRNYSFEELAGEYLNWAEIQRSFSSKKVFIRQLVKVFGNYPLRGLSPRIIEQFQTKRLSGNKPATVNRLLATLKHMFTKAVDWEMVEEDILRKIRKVKMIPENNRRLRFLSKEECRVLIDACSPQLRSIVIVALNTGMRKGEILGLKWERVDLRHGFIFLENTKNGERREIPINTTLRTTLEAIPHGPESEYVFTDRNGNPFKDIRRSFKTALKRAGIQDFKFHDLRHCFASHLVMAGVDLTTVKELLGHKTLTMTLRYSHLSPGHKKKAVEVLDREINHSEQYEKATQWI